MYLFTYLTVAGLACSMWDLVPWPQIKPRPPALGVQSLNCWTTREVPTSMLSWLHNSSYFPRSISQPRCDFCLTNARLHTLRSETVYLLCNFPAPAKWFHVQANLTNAIALSSMASPMCPADSRRSGRAAACSMRHSGADWLFPSQHHNVEDGCKGSGQWSPSSVA